MSDRLRRFAKVNWKRILIGNWSWKRPIYSLAFIYVALLLVACFIADEIIFQPPGTAYSKNRRGFDLLGQEEDAVAIFHLPARAGMPTLLWSHGNAQNLESLKPALDYFHVYGFGVISYDYPGYGESGGEPNEDGCYRAIEKTYLHLTGKLGVAPPDIVLVGQSVGSGPTCWLAARHRHAAIVLLSPFMSAFRSVTRIPLFPGDRFPNHRHLAEVKTPLLVIHGEKDQVIPYSQGKDLFELSPASKKTLLPVEEAGHNDLFESGAFNLPTLILELLDHPGTTDSGKLDE